MEIASQAPEWLDLVSGGHKHIIESWVFAVDAINRARMNIEALDVEIMLHGSGTDADTKRMKQAILHVQEAYHLLYDFSGPGPIDTVA